MKKFKISTIIRLKDNIPEEELEYIKKEFEDLAWDLTDAQIIPSVEMKEVDDGRKELNCETNTNV